MTVMMNNEEATEHINKLGVNPNTTGEAFTPDDPTFFQSFPVKAPINLPGCNRNALEQDFDHSFRLRNNFLLQKKGLVPPKATKTGTTIVGCVFEGGVVLGADTRATEGNIVADKNCEKIHYIAPNIYCCGAGTAADTEYTTNMISSKLEMHRLNESGRQTRMKTAMTLLKQYLFQYQGNIGAALILGGCDDIDGPALYTIYPHGSVDKLPFVTMGSGSLAAMSVFETGWRPNMAIDDAVSLVADGIKAGIFNDLGSGSNVDVCVIHRDGTVDYRRNYEVPVEKGQRSRSYIPPAGTTKVLKSTVKSLEQLSTAVVSTQSMDID
jgi:20S proteasome subunit beta 2